MRRRQIFQEMKWQLRTPAALHSRGLKFQGRRDILCNETRGIGSESLEIAFRINERFHGDGICVDLVLAAFKEVPEVFTDYDDQVRIAIRRPRAIDQ